MCVFILVGFVTMTKFMTIPTVDATPKWWQNYPTEHDVQGKAVTRQPLLRLLLLSLLCIPPYWISCQYYDLKTVFPIPNWPEIDAGIWLIGTIWTYLLAFAGALGLQIMIQIGGYIIAGTAWRTEYSFVLFAVTCAVMCALIGALRSPLKHLHDPSPGKRVWAMLVLCFDALAMFAAGRDVLLLVFAHGR